MTKWEALVNGGLLTGLPPQPSDDCQIPHATEDRIRLILDVEKRLAPGSSVDKLAFYLVVAGLDDIPIVLVAEYIETSLAKFFVVGDGMLRRLQRKPAHIGPIGERKLAHAMAKAVLCDYPLLSVPAYTACEQLLATSFIIYFRTAWRNRKPSPQRQWQRIITPDFLDYQRLPVKTIADADQPGDIPISETMEPAAEKDRLLAQLRDSAVANATELGQAVKDAAMVIVAATSEFPELRDRTPLSAPNSAFAQWVLTLLPPVLAAALFRVSLHTRTERYSNLIPDREESGLEAILRTVLIYWHT